MDIEARRLFGLRCRIVRVRRGLTLEALAEKVGTTKGYLSGIENAKCNPPLAKITVRLCEILRINPEGLLLLSEVAKAPDEVLRIPAYLKFRKDAFQTANAARLVAWGDQIKDKP